MINSILSNESFGISISILFYIFGNFLYKKYKSPFFNPLLISIICIILIIKIFKIPLEFYQNGAKHISLFLAPSTVMLAVPLYKNIHILKKHFFPIIMGCTVGSIVSVGYVLILCKFLNIKMEILISMLPKSVTTPIAAEITRISHGTIPVTVAAVVITGILGALMLEHILKLFRIKNRIAVGVAFGTAAHAVGTSKAVEIGEIEGAMSGLSIAISGIITVLIMPIAIYIYALL